MTDYTSPEFTARNEPHEAKWREDAAALAVAQSRIVEMEKAWGRLLSDCMFGDVTAGYVETCARKALAGTTPPPADDGLRDRLDALIAECRRQAAEPQYDPECAASSDVYERVAKDIEAALRGETP